MADPNVLISCEGVGKKFCRDFHKSLLYGLKDCTRDLIGGRHGTVPPLRQSEFWANYDVNFEVRRGECLGLIGRNGAGKTTLLKLLNGLIRPDHGRITMKGRIGAMIALGAGFNPILTGRENVFINGSILGLSRSQINDRLEEIVEFAELPQAIDSPVRTYSSGMRVRLGFAVAAILIKPDILLLDEVLAVGDAGFRSKCYNAVINTANQSAVILVSHGMPQVARLATRILVLKDGFVASDTKNVAEGIQTYLNLFPRTESSEALSQGARIHSIRLADCVPSARNGTLNLEDRHNVHLSLQIELEQSIDRAMLALVFFDGEQKQVARTDCITNTLPKGKSELRIRIPQTPLAPGNYDLQIVFCDATNRKRPIHLARYEPFCRISVKGTDAEFTCTCPVLFDSSEITTND